MKQNKIYRLMLAFVLTLCAWTTASGYNLTATTQTQCGVTFKVDNAVVTAADADAEVTIVIAPTAGYEVSTVTATAYMSTGEMQAPRRTSIIEGITISPAVSAAVNEYTFTMPAANVNVDVVCEAVAQTVTAPQPAAGGTFTFSPENPKTDETVTITPTPAAGWQVATVILDGDGDNANVNATQSGSNYTYDQPGYGGAITVTFVKTAYTVETGTVTGGSVSAITAATRADGDPATPAATDFYIGDVVTFTAAPTTVTDHLKSLTVSFAGQTATVTPTATATANQYQFTMLAGNATVSAEFTAYVSLENNDVAASKTLIYNNTSFVDLTGNPTVGNILKAVTGDATDIEIAWYHSSDMTTPIGTGETYTIKDSDPGYGIVYVITQSKDENGAALDVPRTKTSSAVAIGKADPTVTSAPSAVDGTLTYSENPQTLFNTGTPSSGTMKYKVTTTNTKPTSTTDFNTTIDQGTDVGTYYLWYYIEGNDSYNSTAINDIAITKAIDKAAPTYTAPAFTALTYTGSAQDLVSAGTSSHGTFTYSTEQTGTYTSTIPQGTNVGDYTVWYKFTGDVNHTNVDATEVTGVKIDPKNIDAASVTLKQGSSTVGENTYTYDGNAKTPTAIVKDGSKTLTAGTDYTITYENNVNAGTATATIVGQGNYTGGPAKTFTIKKAASALSFSSPTSVTKKYNDDDFTKTATVTKGDGAVTYSSSNTNVATVDPTSGLVHILKHNSGSSITIRATIAATANYNSATASYYLYVNGESLSGATFALTQTSYEYDGTAKQPGIYNVQLGNTVLTYGTDYTYGYYSNVNAGTAYAYIQAASGSIYQGYAEMPFTINAVTTTDGNITIVNGGASKVLTINDMGTQQGKTVEAGLAVTTLNYYRSLNASDVSIYTVCLPYAPPTSADLTYYKLTAVNGSVLHFDEIEGNPEAYTPYLVSATVTTDIGVENLNENITMSKTVANKWTAGSYEMRGSLAGFTHDESIGLYILQSGNRWAKVGSDTHAYIPPFRAYVVAVNNAPVRLDSSFGEEEDNVVTDITSICTTDQDGTEHWYDLQGNSIEKPTQSGIYIHNGRKEYVK